MADFESQKDSEQENLAVSIRRLGEAFRENFLDRLTEDEQKQFHEMQQAFSTGSIEPGAYLQGLLTIARRHQIHPKLTAPMRMLLKHYDKISEIQGTRLFEELDRFLTDYENQLAKTQQERDLIGQYRRLRVIESLAALEWTREMRQTFQQTPEDYLAILQESRDFIVPALRFYDYAVERDQALHDRLSRILEQKQVQAVIVLAGGFHSRGFENAFTEAGYPYAVITPKITSLAGEETYNRVMHGELSYKEYLKTTYFDALMQAASADLTAQLNAHELKRDLKVWRDNVIRALAADERISRASQYTRYIDPLLGIPARELHDENFPKTREEILEAIREQITRYRDQKISSFWSRFEVQLGAFKEGLEKLIEEKNLTQESVHGLLTRVSNLPSVSTLAQLAGLDPEIVIILPEISGKMPVLPVSSSHDLKQSELRSRQRSELRDETDSVLLQQVRNLAGVELVQGRKQKVKLINEKFVEEQLEKAGFTAGTYEERINQFLISEGAKQASFDWFLTVLGGKGSPIGNRFAEQFEEKAAISLNETFDFLLAQLDLITDPGGEPLFTAKQKKQLLEEIYPVLLLSFTGITREMTGNPYTFHLLGVALLTVENLLFSNVITTQLPQEQSAWAFDQIVAALHHDTLEDIQSFSRFDLLNYVSRKAMQRIQNLTKTKIHSGLQGLSPELERELNRRDSRDNYARLRLGPKSLVVKYADVLFNFRDAVYGVNLTKSTKDLDWFSTYKSKILDTGGFLDEMVYHPELPIHIPQFSRLANHFLLEMEKISGKSLEKLPSVTALEGEFSRIEAFVQKYPTREEQLAALKVILQSPEKAREMAEWLNGAYYRGMGQEPPPFITAEDTPEQIKEKIAINLAGLYALESGLGLVSEQTGIGFMELLDQINAGTLPEEQMLLLARFANATWKAGQPFRDLKRITRDTFRPAASLTDTELKKDFDQINEAGIKLAAQLRQYFEIQSQEDAAKARSELREGGAALKNWRRWMQPWDLTPVELKKAIEVIGAMRNIQLIGMSALMVGFLSWAIDLVQIRGLTESVKISAPFLIFTAAGGILLAWKNKVAALAGEELLLMVNGIYRYSQNPIYFLYIAGAWSMTLLSPDPFLVLFAPLLTISFLSEIIFERYEMFGLFGQPYRDYSARTPLLIPGPPARESSRSELRQETFDRTKKSPLKESVIRNALRLHIAGAIFWGFFNFGDLFQSFSKFFVQLRLEFGVLAVGIGISIVSAWLMSPRNFVQHLLLTDQGTQRAYEEYIVSGKSAISAWQIMFFGAVIEEVMFRWFVFSILQVHGSSSWNFFVLMISSLWFSMVHSNSTWSTFLMRWRSGMIYGAAFLFTESLAVPIALHFLTNLFFYYRFKKHYQETLENGENSVSANRSEMRLDDKAAAEEKIIGGLERTFGAFPTQATRQRMLEFLNPDDHKRENRLVQFLGNYFFKLFLLSRILQRTPFISNARLQDFLRHVQDRNAKERYFQKDQSVYTRYKGLLQKVLKRNRYDDFLFLDGLLGSLVLDADSRAKGFSFGEKFVDHYFRATAGWQDRLLAWFHNFNVQSGYSQIVFSPTVNRTFLREAEEFIYGISGYDLKPEDKDFLLKMTHSGTAAVLGDAVLDLVILLERWEQMHAASIDEADATKEGYKRLHEQMSARTMMGNVMGHLYGKRRKTLNERRRTQLYETMVALVYLTNGELGREGLEAAREFVFQTYDDYLQAGGEASDKVKSFIQTALTRRRNGQEWLGREMSRSELRPPSWRSTAPFRDEVTRAELRVDTQSEVPTDETTLQKVAGFIEGYRLLADHGNVIRPGSRILLVGEGAAEAAQSGEIPRAMAGSQVDDFEELGITVVYLRLPKKKWDEEGKDLINQLYFKNFSGVIIVEVEEMDFYEMAPADWRNFKESMIRLGERSRRTVQPMTRRERGLPPEFPGLRLDVTGQLQPQRGRSELRPASQWSTAPSRGNVTRAELRAAVPYRAEPLILPALGQQIEVEELRDWLEVWKGLLPEEFSDLEIPIPTIRQNLEHYYVLSIGKDTRTDNLAHLQFRHPVPFRPDYTGQRAIEISPMQTTPNYRGFDLRGRRLMPLIQLFLFQKLNLQKVMYRDVREQGREFIKFLIEQGILIPDDELVFQGRPAPMGDAYWEKIDQYFESKKDGAVEFFIDQNRIYHILRDPRWVEKFLTPSARTTADPTQRSELRAGTSPEGVAVADSLNSQQIETFHRWMAGFFRLDFITRIDEFLRYLDKKIEAATSVNQNSEALRTTAKENIETLKGLVRPSAPEIPENYDADLRKAGISPANLHHLVELVPIVYLEYLLKQLDPDSMLYRDEIKETPQNWFRMNDIPENYWKTEFMRDRLEDLESRRRLKFRAPKLQITQKPAVPGSKMTAARSELRTSEVKSEEQVHTLWEKFVAQPPNSDKDIENLLTASGIPSGSVQWVLLDSRTDRQIRERAGPVFDSDDYDVVGYTQRLWAVELSKKFLKDLNQRRADAESLSAAEPLLKFSIENILQHVDLGKEGKALLLAFTEPVVGRDEKTENVVSIYLMDNGAGMRVREVMENNYRNPGTTGFGAGISIMRDFDWPWFYESRTERWDNFKGAIIPSPFPTPPQGTLFGVHMFSPNLGASTAVSDGQRSELRAVSVNPEVLQSLNSFLTAHGEEILRYVRFLNIFGDGVWMRQTMELLFLAHPFERPETYQGQWEALQKFFVDRYLPVLRQQSPVYQTFETRARDQFVSRRQRMRAPSRSFRSTGIIPVLLGAMVILDPPAGERLFSLLMNEARAELGFLPEHKPEKPSPESISQQLWKPKFVRPEQIRRELSANIVKAEKSLGYQFPKSQAVWLGLGLVESVQSIPDQVPGEAYRKTRTERLTTLLSVLGDALLDEWIARQIHAAYGYDPKDISVGSGFNPEDFRLLKSNATLSEIMDRTDLWNSVLRHSDGNQVNEEQLRHRKADTFEAITAAVYLSGGWEKMDEVLKRTYQRTFVPQAAAGSFNVASITRSIRSRSEMRIRMQDAMDRNKIVTVKINAELPESLEDEAMIAFLRSQYPLDWEERKSLAGQITPRVGAALFPGLFPDEAAQRKSYDWDMVPVKAGYFSVVYRGRMRIGDKRYVVSVNTPTGYGFRNQQLGNDLTVQKYYSDLGKTRYHPRPLLGGKVRNEADMIFEPTRLMGPFIQQFQEKNPGQWNRLIPYLQAMAARGQTQRISGDLNISIFDWVPDSTEVHFSGSLGTGPLLWEVDESTGKKRFVKMSARQGAEFMIKVIAGLTYFYEPDVDGGTTVSNFLPNSGDVVSSGGEPVFITLRQRQNHVSIPEFIDSLIHLYAVDEGKSAMDLVGSQRPQAVLASFLPISNPALAFHGLKRGLQELHGSAEGEKLSRQWLIEYFKSPLSQGYRSFVRQFLDGELASSADFSSIGFRAPQRSELRGGAEDEGRPQKIRFDDRTVDAQYQEGQWQLLVNDGRRIEMFRAGTFEVSDAAKEFLRTLGFEVEQVKRKFVEPEIASQAPRDIETDGEIVIVELKGPAGMRSNIFVGAYYLWLMGKPLGESPVLAEPDDTLGSLNRAFNRDIEQSRIYRALTKYPQGILKEELMAAVETVMSKSGTGPAWHEQDLDLVDKFIDDLVAENNPRQIRYAEMLTILDFFYQVVISAQYQGFLGEVWTTSEQRAVGVQKAAFPAQIRHLYSIRHKVLLSYWQHLMPGQPSWDVMHAELQNELKENPVRSRWEESDPEKPVAERLHEIDQWPWRQAIIQWRKQLPFDQTIFPAGDILAAFRWEAIVADEDTTQALPETKDPFVQHFSSVVSTIAEKIRIQTSQRTRNFGDVATLRFVSQQMAQDLSDPDKKLPLGPKGKVIYAKRKGLIEDFLREIVPRDELKAVAGSLRSELREAPEDVLDSMREQLYAPVRDTQQMEHGGYFQLQEGEWTVQPVVHAGNQAAILERKMASGQTIQLRQAGDYYGNYHTHPANDYPSPADIYQFLAIGLAAAHQNVIFTPKSTLSLSNAERLQGNEHYALSQVYLQLLGVFQTKLKPLYQVMTNLGELVPGQIPDAADLIPQVILNLYPEKFSTREYSIGWREMMPWMGFSVRMTPYETEGVAGETLVSPAIENSEEDWILGAEQQKTRILNGEVYIDALIDFYFPLVLAKNPPAEAEVVLLHVIGSISDFLREHGNIPLADYVLEKGFSEYKKRLPGDPDPLFDIQAQFIRIHGYAVAQVKLAELLESLSGGIVEDETAPPADQDTSRSELRLPEAVADAGNIKIQTVTPESEIPALGEKFSIPREDGRRSRADTMEKTMYGQFRYSNYRDHLKAFQAQGLSFPFNSDLKGAHLLIIGPSSDPHQIIGFLEEYPEIGSIHFVDIRQSILESLLEELTRYTREKGIKVPLRGYLGSILDENLVQAVRNEITAISGKAPAVGTSGVDLVFDSYVFAEGWWDQGQLVQAGKVIHDLLKPDGLHITFANAHPFPAEGYPQDSGMIQIPEPEITNQWGSYMFYQKRSRSELRHDELRIMDKNLITGLAVSEQELVAEVLSEQLDLDVLIRKLEERAGVQHGVLESEFREIFGLFFARLEERIGGMQSFDELARFAGSEELEALIPEELKEGDGEELIAEIRSIVAERLPAVSTQLAVQGQSAFAQLTSDARRLLEQSSISELNQRLAAWLKLQGQSEGAFIPVDSRLGPPKIFMDASLMSDSNFDGAALSGISYRIGTPYEQTAMEIMKKLTGILAVGYKEQKPLNLASYGERLHGVQLILPRDMIWKAADSRASLSGIIIEREAVLKHSLKTNQVVKLTEWVLSADYLRAKLLKEPGVPFPIVTQEVLNEFVSLLNQLAKDIQTQILVGRAA